MNPADSFIIKQQNRWKQIILYWLQSYEVKLFLLLLDFLDPLLMFVLLWVILGLLPGQLQHGCLSKKVHLIRIYGNHLSVEEGNETVTVC